MKNFMRLIRWKNILVIALTMMAMRLLVIFPVFRVYGIEVMFPDWGFYLLMLATMLIAAGGYVINDYFDVHIDSVNRSKDVVVGVAIPRRKAIAMHLWLSIFGLACGIAATVATHRFWYVFIFIGAFAALWIYSRDLKKSAFWGNLLIAMLSGIVPMLVGSTEYFAVADSISSWDISHIRAVKMAMQVVIFFSVFAFIYTLVREIIKDCEDVEGDRANGVRSIPVKIGLKKTNYIVSALAIVSIALVLFFWYGYLSKSRFFAYEMLPAVYLYALVALPTLVVAVASLFGTAKRKYSVLSGFVKAIMVLGVAFSIVFCYIIIGNGTI
ncbi:MAG: geranylgeranylglycerol-phosphate geranylgeranyltransferase [Bacteroidales bacterium]|nr:geranylgeranylglycerol-phosphate geranylgeranyltransferase [Bacteroidales bacterium]